MSSLPARPIQPAQPGRPSAAGVRSVHSQTDTSGGHCRRIQATTRLNVDAATPLIVTVGVATLLLITHPDLPADAGELLGQPVTALQSDYPGVVIRRLPFHIDTSTRP